MKKRFALILFAFTSLACKPRTDSALREAGGGSSLPSACIGCHAGAADLPVSLKNEAQLAALVPFMNRATRDDMAKRAKLEGEALKSYEQLFANPPPVTYAVPTCKGRSLELPTILEQGSPLAAELSRAMKQGALIPYGGGMKTWQGSTDNDGRRARLLTERNAPNPFMYDLMGYNSDAAREFPWNNTAGTDLVAGVKAQKFFLSPESGAFKLGTRDRQSSPSYFGTSSNINGPQVGWEFFPGTMFGEVVAMTTNQGIVPFEIRLRRKVGSGLWSMDVLRPFASKEEFVKAAADACKSLNVDCPELGSAGGTSRSTSVREFVSAATFGTKRDPLTLSSTAGNALEPSAIIDELPALPAAVFEKLLRETPFRSVFGQPWVAGASGNAWSPVHSGAGPSIVPKGYLGAFLPLTRGSCVKCHSSAGRHVDRFDPVREQMYDPAPNDAPRPRTWYHFVPGNDGILSFHPFSEATVQSGGNVLAADLKQVERSTLEQCFVDFGRSAESLFDDGVSEGDPDSRSFVPGSGATTARPASTTGGSSAGSTSSGGISPGSPSPGRPSSGGSDGSNPGSSPANGTCYCVVQGTQCVVVDAGGKVLVYASLADICSTASECTQELYRDVAGSCRSPLSLKH